MDSGDTFAKIKMACDDGDGCDDEMERGPRWICIVTIVTTVTAGIKSARSCCEKTRKFQKSGTLQEHTKGGHSQHADVVQRGLGMLPQQAIFSIELVGKLRK